MMSSQVSAEETEATEKKEIVQAQAEIRPLVHALTLTTHPVSLAMSFLRRPVQALIRPCHAC